MRGGNNLLEGEQRRVGAGLLVEHIKAGSGNATIDERLVQGSLIDNAATSSVDDVHGRLDLVQGLLTDQAHGLGSLGKMHGDEVSFGKQIIEADHAHAQLRRAGRLHVGVIGDELDAEG